MVSYWKRWKRKRRCTSLEGVNDVAIVLSLIGKREIDDRHKFAPEGGRMESRGTYQARNLACDLKLIFW